MRLVAIEEHVNRPNVKDYMGWQPKAVLARLAPSVEQRIADMDAAGIAMSVLSAPLPAPAPDGAADAPAPILEAAARLDVPIYLHPAPPPKRVTDIYYTGPFGPRVSQMLSCSGLGWHLETSVHVTRLIVSGVFDRIPGLKIIIGHISEGLAFHLHRLDRQLNELAGLPKPVSQYLTEHVWYTTSGYFFNEQFDLARAMFGDDRMVFSVDYPFEDTREAAEWFNRLDLPVAVREKMAHGTAEQLLRLPVSANSKDRAADVSPV